MRDAVTTSLCRLVAVIVCIVARCGEEIEEHLAAHSPVLRRRDSALIEGDRAAGGRSARTAQQQQ